jgi:transcriptional regulator with XRE-family HTH domain
MPKTVTQPHDQENFGQRLERLRMQAGYSLRELAKEIGISARMIVYYEKHSERPPAHILPQVANALGVTTDQLLGVIPLKQNARTADNRLWRRFKKVEQLPVPQRKQITQILDTFLEREKLKKGL